MGSDGRHVVLTSAQVRAVSATLRVVEEAVEGIERSLASPASGLTFRFQDDLDAKERQAVENACGRIRAALPGVGRCLGVERAERSLRAKIRGECSVVWAAVEDTRGERLRGYGPLSAEAALAVDDTLEEVAAPLVEILRWLASPSPRDQAAPTAPARGDGGNRT